MVGPVRRPYPRPRRSTLRARGIVGAATFASLLAAAAGAPAQQGRLPALRLSAPAERATGVEIPLRGSGAPPGAEVTIEARGERGWRRNATVAADARGRFQASAAPPRAGRRRLLRARAGGSRSAPVAVRTRDVTLAAVGDINLGDGVATVMERRGLAFPWTGVGPTLRAADIAFGNLECSVSNRGSPVQKQFRFRGRPRALAVAARVAGLDVLNLANNHVGDYGRRALLDTIRHVRRAGIWGVGAGRDAEAAHAPQIVERLGLRVAFLGFSDIGPLSFRAGPATPGTAFASHAAIRAGVRAARREADVVVVTFHWGVERDTRENARQRAFAGTALRAGAAAVVGAHPHVLQPLRRDGRRIVAYSLGNFVWAAGSPLTSRTAILRLRLSTRGVEGVRMLPARIRETRPALVR